MLAPMRNLLRIIFCLNVALWLGAGLFLTSVVGPTLFSGELSQQITRRQAGIIAQAILARYFAAQLVAASVALAGAFLARNLGWKWPRFALPVALLLLTLVTVANFGLQPKMLAWNERRYAASPGSMEEQTAKKQFGLLHGLAQLGNLIVLAGVAFHGSQQLAFFSSSSANSASRH